jgi:hypothetical protein
MSQLSYIKLNNIPGTVRKDAAIYDDFVKF